MNLPSRFQNYRIHHYHSSIYLAVILSLALSLNNVSLFYRHDATQLRSSKKEQHCFEPTTNKEQNPLRRPKNQASADQSGGDIGAGHSSQLMLHGGGSSSSSNLFKDLSGPTSGKIQTLDVICGKNFMTVRAEFSGPFYGLVFSKGTYGHENCIYVKPNSGLTHAAFNVYYDQCGTKPDLQGKFYENTIVIQYGSDIIEAYDEAKRLRCEWFEAYEKPATFKPAIPVADLEVVEMNFQGDVSANVLRGTTLTIGEEQRY